MIRRRACWIGTGMVLLVFGSSGCSDSTSEIGQLAAPRESAPQREGSETCAECHPSQVDTWSRNPMARSLEPVELGELDGLGTVLDEPAGYSYRFMRPPNGAKHILGEERKDDPQHALGGEVLFAIGAGTRDRSYVLGHGAGMWFAPVEVVTHAQGREAVLAPHAAMEPGSRFQFPVTSECLGCHTDALPPPAFPLNLRRPESVWKPRGISCVACHGNANEHADWQLAADQPEQPDPLIAGAQLKRTEKLSVCAACHLQGDTRLVLDGPDLGPPKPGGDLVDSRALFVAREATEEVGFVSHVERLVLSACYLQSEMTCTTCHDPHRSLSEPQERARVRAVCLDCHGGSSIGHSTELAGRAGAKGIACSGPGAEPERVWPDWIIQPAATEEPDCVDCHMPRTGTFDVARVTIQDHYIRRQPRDVRGPYGDGELRALESASADWKRFAWPQSEASWGEDSGIWFMAYASKGFSQQALERLDEPPGARALAIPMFHHLRAGVLKSVGRLEEARDAYQRALELNPNLAESAINLGLLLGELGEAKRGMLLLDRVVARSPAAWTALRNRAVLRSRAGDLQGALADLQKAFAALPSSEVARALAKLHRGRGEQQAAKRWDKISVELNPGLRNQSSAK